MTIKQQLHQLCRKHVEARIKNVTEAINMAKEAANEETKSSAGDKYETGRAMMQLEIENQARQLDEAEKLLKVLLSMDTHPSTPTNGISVGNLIITTNASFYLSVSIGKLTVEDKDYFAISPSSPIGSVLMGKKQGETFSFNGKPITIQEVI